MAASPLKPALVAAIASAGIAVAAGALAADTRARSTLPITVDAASTEVDYKKNAILLRDVMISQGDIRVQADEARATGGLNFVNSRWTFSGSVKIRADGGTLSSDQAVVTFANNLISRAVINGKPAVFEQARAGTAEMARGRANTIDYEPATGTVSLLTAAWLTDGRNEIRGERLVYNVREQRVQARAEPSAAGQTGSGRVRIIIQPEAPAEERKPDARPRPEAPPTNNPTDPKP
jgi:lipopolysaccharide export system protein LptA